jgi:RNA polymerase sigma-70 factor (ECF subfamily)
MNTTRAEAARARERRLLLRARALGHTRIFRLRRSISRRAALVNVVERAEMLALTDRELVVKAQKGDELAFEELVSRYQERLYWVAYNMVGNSEEARDISQEAFVRVFKSLERYDPKYNFYTWLYQIAVNICIDHLRKKGSSGVVSLDGLSTEDQKFEIVSDVEAPGEGLERRELVEQIQAILDKLPLKYKTVLALRDLEGMHCREIARVMKCSYPTLRWRLFQARRLFKEAWEREFKMEREFIRQNKKQRREKGK